MRKRGPWIAVGAMAALVLVLLVVLLVRDDGVDVRDLVADAPGAVDAEGTAELTMTVEFGGALDLDVTGTGGVDFTTGAGFFELDLLGQRFELRSAVDALYIKPVDDDTWYALTGDDGDALDSFGAGPSEASAFVDLLRGEAVEVEDLGHEEIQGGSARHLRVEMDVESALAAVDESHRAAIENLAELAADDGVITFEVWIDERNLPVRQRLEGDVQGASLVVTVDLTSWGDPLDVAVPPEGDIRPIGPAELAQLFGRPAP